MPDDVTIVMVFRERVSTTPACLRRLYEVTGPLVPLICVDNASPPPVAAEIATICKAHGTTLLRSDRQLSPNASRNMALPHVETPYVCFIDNDILLSEGWLVALRDCAESTGADIVGPLYLEELGGVTQIHMFGGRMRLADDSGRRRFFEKHDHSHADLASREPQLKRQKSELVEFHAVLVRKSLLDRLGPFDEQVLSLCDHADFCLQAMASGAQIWIEPAARLKFFVPEGLPVVDRAFFARRWCEDWNRRSVARLASKYRLSPTDPGLNGTAHWCRMHRRRGLYGPRPEGGALGRLAYRLRVGWNEMLLGA